jgi:hypothetical protein
MDRLTFYRFLKRHIAPGVTHSQRLYRDAHLKTLPRWLAPGCGRQFMPESRRGLSIALLSVTTPAGNQPGQRTSVAPHE